MTDYVDRAAFMDQVKVGDIITINRYDPSTLEPVPETWTVTGARLDHMGSDKQPIVSLIGIGENGEPRHTTAAPWVNVIIRERIPDDQPETQP